MYEINFYAYFRSDDEPTESRGQLTRFLKHISPLLMQLGSLCKIVWEKHALAPEPNVLKHSYPEPGCLLLPFSFQYLNLGHALRKVDVLKAVLSDLAKEAYLDFDCEYHLDEC